MAASGRDFPWRRRTRGAEFGVAPRGLSGDAPPHRLRRQFGDATSEIGKADLIREGGGQRDLDAGDHFRDPPGDFDQAKADRVELGIAPRNRGPRRHSAQGQHQPVGGGMDQETELVGGGLGARGTAGGEMQLVRLDQVFKPPPLERLKSHLLLKEKPRLGRAALLALTRWVARRHEASSSDDDHDLDAIAGRGAPAPRRSARPTRAAPSWRALPFRRTTAMTGVHPARRSTMSVADKVQSRHCDRLAIVYVRQSTLQQVERHQESTRLQYGLVERAIQFGWSRERVVVIDDDLGRSGAAAAMNPGFQRLVAEVGLGRVGLVLGVEMSRLARSCRDWHQLLEICAVFDTLLADTDGVYDPGFYNDRLLLGLKGTMSEAELHLLKGRMLAGRQAKAQRGELFFNLPRGYVRTPAGAIALDPDEQVQATIRLVFDVFERRRTINGVLRYLVDHQVHLPYRVRSGAATGELEWHRPNRYTLAEMLRNPIYAGAYAYGRRVVDARRQVPGRAGTGRAAASAAAVLLKDRLPAYMSWDSFERNQSASGSQPQSARGDRPRRSGALGRPAGVRPMRSAHGHAVSQSRTLSALFLHAAGGELRGCSLPVAERPRARRARRRLDARGARAGGFGGQPATAGRSGAGARSAASAMAATARTRPLRGRARAPAV